MSKYPTTGTKQIGIYFGDNDFYYTVMPFLEMLLPGEHTGHRAKDHTFTKAEIVELFNEMAYGFYLAKQSGWQYNTSDDDRTRVKKYLKINESRVYLDNELTEFINKNPGRFNADIYCVDFTERYLWAI